ncbi:MAG: radical SAM protein [candidate division WS1 bacterium]|nr:radical SAM protein [candidate division WS1 bacterium]
MARRQDHREQLEALQRLFENQHPALYLARRLFSEASPTARRALINNLAVNTTLVGGVTRRAREAAGLGAPVLIVISPTMRCNLRCYGCYAGEYASTEDMSLELMDRIITEGKDIGVYLYTISGGEPFIRRDLLDLYAQHNDCEFLVYTNGTLIDDSVAERLAELGNVGPAISVEGFEEETDGRRGKGTWKKIMAAMDRLHEAGVIFGFSGTVTRHNANLISSEALVDLMIEKGCFFGWYFMYIPIGRKPDISLMPTPEQRRKCGDRVEQYRATKPIFVADFWNDGLLTRGCMAGGRLYLHVTTSGWVEPCVFAHFTADNIRDKSLEEILDSKFFRAIRRRFPWSENHLTPCAIIDNPWVLRGAVAEAGARPSHPGAETILTDLAPHLDQYSAEMKTLTEPRWEAILAEQKRTGKDALGVSLTDEVAAH